MKTQRLEISDPEDGGLIGNSIAWLIMQAFWICSWIGSLRGRIRTWLKLKRVCAWCKPMRYMGGNPFAKTVTHGQCPACQEKTQAEYERLKAAGLL